MKKDEKITTTLKISTPAPSGLDDKREFLWALVDISNDEPDETGAFPTVTVNVPLFLNKSDPIEVTLDQAKEKAKALLEDAVKAF
ncbi:hypothetical protein [Salidesulfovibrio brasiliensis]|uniref:hypothetical protein n=1 Tax=Salidesulfovibrio brasiliensis TaxID=221711 RepID=UPI0006D04419|nr:hypothetical protein [Salidesulfovibrio brasiliensis]